MSLFPPSLRRLEVLARATVPAVLLSLAPLALAQGAGYWHTSGNRILDEDNRQVRITGINWYGFETAKETPGGLTTQDYKTILQTIKAQGFNTVRIPLSSQMIETPSSTLSIGSSNSTGAINSDLQGLNSLQVLDKIVSYAGTVGLKLILDHHRSEAGSSAEANGLWYTSSYPESAWVADWVALADRYLGNPTVIGFDLHNEPHTVSGGGACWDCGGAIDWHLAAERAGNAVMGANPNLLLFVEGTDAYNGDYYWWGGNLEGVLKSPVVLSQPNHVVYTAHDYGPHESTQSWFNGSTSYATLSNIWSKHWAYISQENLAPVWLGEFGTTNDAADLESSVAGSQGQWFESLIQFLSADPNLSWNYWALNGEDTYALLNANYDATPVSSTKESMLASIHFPLMTATTAPAAPNGLTASVISTSQINLKWSAVAGSGMTYNVYFGTSPGSTNTLVASGLTTTSVQARNLNCCTLYYFTVRAVSLGVASAPSNQVSATTQTPAPTAPLNLTAVAQSASQINLAWLAVAAAGVGYTIYSGMSANSVNTVIANNVATPTYQVVGLKPETTYYYDVKTVEQGISSPASKVASATTQSVGKPAAPTGLVATAASSTQVSLSWAPSTTAGVTYNVYGSTVAGGAGSLIAGGVTAPSFQAAGLNASTTYYFTVRAVLDGLPSSASNMATASMPETAALSCHVAYSASEDWATGFVARIAITNSGSTPINGWKLTWTYAGNQQLTQSWDGTYAQTGESIALSNASFNGTITPNATSTGIGFQATYTGHNVAPAAFFLNGVACH
jgi:endoglucanase